MPLMDLCMICRKPVLDYKPERCCDGVMCGCQGQPTNPCVCSAACSDAVFNFIGMDPEARRIAAGIERWQPPRRIQLSRKRGWRMPPNTSKVDRTTIYGNPYQGGDVGGDRNYLANLHREYLKRDMPEVHESRARAVVELAGKNLACWCPLCPKHKDGRPYNEPCKDCGGCHADNWLDVANGGSGNAG
jgi:hypothetical protein